MQQFAHAPHGPVEPPRATSTAVPPISRTLTHLPPPHLDRWRTCRDFFEVCAVHIRCIGHTRTTNQCRGLSSSPKRNTRQSIAMTDAIHAFLTFPFSITPMKTSCECVDLFFHNLSSIRFCALAVHHHESMNRRSDSHSLIALSIMRTPTMLPNGFLFSVLIVNDRSECIRH
jgi:hypothetical protein